MDIDRTVMVSVDLQGKLMDMVHEPRRLMEANQRFLQIAEMFELPLVLTEQYPQGLGETHEDLLESFQALTSPTARISKTSFGCCGEPSFLAALCRLGEVDQVADLQVVLAGIETHICVLQTALGLVERGAEVFVAWDCTSARGEAYHRHGLERMQQAGVRLTNHESLGFELARDKGHPAFRRFSGMLREGQPSEPLDPPSVGRLGEKE